MPKWLNTLNLSDLWEAHEKEEITIDKLSKEVAKRLRTVPDFTKPDLLYLNDERDDIADEFEFLGDADVDDFDYVLSLLYDWADTKVAGNFFDAEKVCWVKTQL